VPPAPPVASSVPPTQSAPPAPPAAPPASSTPPASSGSSPAQAPGDAALSGTWKSASCGARKYERLITFGKEGSFSAEDRVSPCPPKVTCVWSGIVSRKGAFKRSGDTISLTISGEGKGPGAQPFPTTLSIDGATNAPAEPGAGGQACVYQR
jgi:hypothetical protein